MRWGKVAGRTEAKGGRQARTIGWKGSHRQRQGQQPGAEDTLTKPYSVRATKAMGTVEMKTPAMGMKLQMKTNSPNRPIPGICRTHMPNVVRAVLAIAICACIDKLSVLTHAVLHNVHFFNHFSLMQSFVICAFMQTFVPLNSLLKTFLPSPFMSSFVNHLCLRLIVVHAPILFIVHSCICMCMHRLLVCSFIDSLMHCLVWSCVHSFVYSLVHSSMHSLVLLFIRLFVHPSIHPPIHPSIHPSIHRCMQSYIRHGFPGGAMTPFICMCSAHATMLCHLTLQTLRKGLRCQNPALRCFHRHDVAPELAQPCQRLHGSRLRMLCRHAVSPELAEPCQRAGRRR